MKNIFLFVLVSVLSISGYSQKTQGKKVLMLPRAYQNPTGTLEAAGSVKLSSTSTNVWIVFSDRSDNPTFMTETGESQFKKMAYMEAFYVMEEKGDYLHLAKYELDPALIKADKFTRDVPDWGWAKKTQLLLWPNCLVDPVTKFTIKALSINSVTNLNDIASYAKGKSLKIFNDPELKEENQTEVRLFDFLYIFKKSENAVLIATTDKLNRVQAKRAEKKVMGWVSKSVINEWKDRITLEPNWDSDAVRERKGQNIKTTIFSTTQAAEAYKSTGVIDKKSVLWEDDPASTTRKINEWKRLPYINTGSGTTGIVRTGAVTDVFNSQGEAVIQSDDQSLIERAYNRLRENYRKVNIVFVIDGSDVLSDYYSSIFNTVANCANQLDKNDEEARNSGAITNTFKLGMVVYRDNSDRECDLEVQEKSLTTNYQDIADFLEKEVKFGSCNKKETRRGLYDGIRRGIRQFQETEDQTNIIILIGAGSNKNDPAGQAEIIDLMAKYRVGLLMFQAKHPMNESYDDFTMQAKELIQTAAQKIQEDISRIIVDRKTTLALLMPQGRKNVYKLNCPKKSPIPGVIMFSDMLNPIDPAALKDQVFATLKELDDAKEEILEGMESKLKGQGTRTDMNEGMYAFLTQMKVNTDLLRKSSFENIQLFVEGFTSRTCDKLTNPLYKFCLFLSYAELSDLINDIKKIEATGGNRTDARKNMQEAFYSLLAARIGPKEAKKKMSSVTAGDLFALITGMPTKNELLRKVKLDEITKEKVISENQLDELRLEITNKLEDLEKYKDENNSFQSNDINYYWVPEDKLP